MSKYLPGPEALYELDALIADQRADLREAMDEAEAVEAQQTALRERQWAHYRELADIRMDLLRDTDDVAALDRLHDEARDLIDAHDAYVQQAAQALADAAADIAALETQREKLRQAHTQAAGGFEAKVAQVENTLKDDPAYQALAQANEDAAAIATRARQKLALATTDRQEKGAPYEQDPLFSYLWDRKFRTPKYKALPFFRTLDQWVAGLCKYDDHYLNYNRLIDLPVRLAEHADRQDAKAETAQQALENAEDDALTAAGADALRLNAEEVFAHITATDDKMRAAEDEHQTVAAQHEAALDAQSGPIIKARALLEEGLKRARFPDLRVLAAETVGTDDDAIVDSLVHLRAEETVLQQESGRMRARPKDLRRELKTLEALRQAFKREQWDSAAVKVRRSTFEDALDSLIRGRLTKDRALRQIRKSVRRARTSASTGFGGHRRRRGAGVPAILQDVMWDIVVETARHGARGGFDGTFGGRPTRRRSPRPTTRRRSSGSGGFRTGGGF